MSLERQDIAKVREVAVIISTVVCVVACVFCVATAFTINVKATALTLLGIALVPIIWMIFLWGGLPCQVLHEASRQGIVCSA